MNVSGRVFEMAIPSLISLRLHCVHFGIIGASDFEWKDVPRLYPHLEEFTLLWPCKSIRLLTLDAVKLIANQLPKLKYICLPRSMLQSDDDKQIAVKLMAQFQTLPSPIDLYFREDIKTTTTKIVVTTNQTMAISEENSYQ